MLGSDYPFPLGEQRVGSLIGSQENLPAATRAKLLHENATAFFNLDAERSALGGARRSA
jgi:aminocarboxymuconate-semialdehyde decarboxylase